MHFWGLRGEGLGVRVRGEEWKQTVVFPPFSAYKYCSVSFLQNIRFLLTFRKICEMSKTMTGNRTVLTNKVRLSIKLTSHS